MVGIVSNFLKLILPVTVLVASFMLILTPEPSIHRIGVLIGLIGIMVTVNTNIISAIKFTDSLRKDLRLVQIQDLILNEVKKSNTEVMNLVVSQADLLSKMTELAVKNSDKETPIQ